MKEPTPEEIREFENRYGKFNPRSRLHQKRMKKIQDELRSNHHRSRFDRKYINNNINHIINIINRRSK